MKADSIFALLEELAKSDVFAVGQSLSPDSRFVEIDGWDSFKHLRFLLAVEDEFGFEISPEEGETLATLGDLARLVEQAAKN